MISPRDAAPHATRRALIVEQTMEALAGVEDHPVHEQLELLSAAQESLAAVLRGDDVPQANIPGMR